MNRKKIAILLTGLVVTSSIFTGCGSSNNNNKTSSNRVRVAQHEPRLRRASERTVTEYNEGQMEQYPNVAYADDIIDNSIGNEMKEDMNSFSTENQFDNVQNYENSTNKNDMNLNNGNLFDTTTPNYQMNPSDEIITNDQNQMHNFENSTTQTPIQTPINGFSNVVDEEYSGNDLNQNQTPNSNENSQNPQTKQNVQAPELFNTPKATEENQVGQINVIKAKGTSEITEDKPQGVAEISFKLSGDVLNAVETTNSKTLSTLLQAAYTETIEDANNNYSGTPTTTNRQALQKALVEIFKPSETAEIKMVFKSNDGGVKTIPFKAEDIFPDTSKSPNYIRYIIDLDSTSGRTRSERSINSQDIVIKMMVRVADPDGKELKTNTEYGFVGIDGNKNLKTIEVGNGSNKDELVGFKVPDFKTGKIPSKIKAQNKDGDSVIYETDSANDEGTQQNDAIYLSNVTQKIYVSMDKLLKDTDKVEKSGTRIKFKSIILNDSDETINKVEIVDDRGNKYPVSLIPVDYSKPKSDSYLEVTGLKRETPYIFTKLNITYRIGNREEIKTIHFANFDSNASSGDKLKINALSIETTAFSAPKLELGAAHDGKVKLPNELDVDTVKNDSTALRYILKVDDSEGFVGDVRVNGLRGGEQSKIEKIVDEKAKTNYYVVTLFNLATDYNYDFVILEVDYKDPDGRELVTSQTLKVINESGTGKTDNKTEATALTGTEAFNVVVNPIVNSKNARSTEVPIFIDDMQDRFLRVDLIAPSGNPDAKVSYEDGKLKFTDLKPDTSTVFTVNMIYRNSDNQEAINTKYITISTPKVSDLDIKTATIQSGSTDAEVKFELYSDAKSKVRTVVVKDGQEKEIKSTWNEETKTLKLEGLTEKTEYKNLKITFTLENGNKVEYTLDTFTTLDKEVKPTGKVAEFVSRVYKIALGREPEVEGWEYWVKKLESKEISATELIAENLMTQSEFVDRELSKKSFVTTMYSLVVNREPDEEGQRYWERKYDEYRRKTPSIEALRIKIAREMMDQPEFKELIEKLNLKY